MLTKAAFICAVLLCLSPWGSPPLSLALGLAIGIAGANPWRAASSRWTRELLKWSIVGLGFGMDFHTVLETGRTSYVYTGLGIATAMGLGLLFGRVLKVPFNAAFLISAGTSICGGSAIAAVGPVVAADEEEMSVALGTVFILNSIALLIFPAIGNALHLTQSQFGLWAALAIHDTSSVVGAGAKYGAIALAVMLAGVIAALVLGFGDARLQRRNLCARLLAIGAGYFALQGFFKVAPVENTGQRVSDRFFTQLHMQLFQVAGIFV